MSRRQPKRPAAVVLATLAAGTCALILCAVPALAADNTDLPETDRKAGAEAIRFQQCILCHGTQANGNPATQAPALAGLAPWYVEAQLHAYRAGVRGISPQDSNGKAMQAVASALSDTDIIDAAAYVTSRRWQQKPASVAGDPERGAKLYERCTACHGDAAEGNQPLAAPALAAQRDWYLLDQLRAYQEGRRGSHPDERNGAAMQAVAASLSGETDLQDVVAYIAMLQHDNKVSAARRPSP